MYDITGSSLSLDWSTVDNQDDEDNETSENVATAVTYSVTKDDKDPIIGDWL